MIFCFCASSDSFLNSTSYTATATSSKVFVYLMISTPELLVTNSRLICSSVGSTKSAHETKSAQNAKVIPHCVGLGMVKKFQRKSLFSFVKQTPRSLSVPHPPV